MLRQQLFASSRSLINQSLKALENENYPEFVTFGSNGLEHLVKAALIKVNPVLIADTSNSSRAEQNLLILTEGANYSLDQIKTVSLDRALNRLREFKIFQSTYEKLSILIETRNSYFHLATKPDIDYGVIVVYIRAIDDLIQFLGFNDKWFWGTNYDLGRSLLDDSIKHLKAIVNARLRTSKAYYKEHFGDVESALLQRGLPNLWSGEELQPCPVCGSFAIFSGDHEFDFEDEWDEDGYAGTYATNGRFYAESMRCPICRLKLNSKEELEIAGVETVYLTDETPESLGWDEEPDEDFLRDR